MFRGEVNRNDKADSIQADSQSAVAIVLSSATEYVLKLAAHPNEFWSVGTKVLRQVEDKIVAKRKQIGVTNSGFHYR